MWVQYVCAARQALPTPSGDRVGEPKEVPSGARHISPARWVFWLLLYLVVLGGAIFFTRVHKRRYRGLLYPWASRLS